MMEASVAFIVAFIVTALTGTILLHYWPAVATERLHRPGGPLVREQVVRWGEPHPSRWRRTIARLGDALAPRDDGKRSRYRERLSWAGYHDPAALPLFVGIQVASALASASAYLLYGLVAQRALPHLVPTLVALACFGFALPRLWLADRAKRRQREIVHAVPDVLDCLTVCVEAGMAFDAALARVADQPDVQQSPLHQELLRVHLEVRAGRPRDEALRGLAERTGVQELRALVAIFVQTMRLGTPLGKALRVHADDARIQRRHRAEKQAHLAPIKMLFPTVAFLMPSFFLVAMAPSLLGLMRVLGTLGRR